MIPSTLKPILALCLLFFCIAAQSQSLDTIYREFYANGFEKHQSQFSTILPQSDTSWRVISYDGYPYEISYTGKVICQDDWLYPFPLFRLDYFPGYKLDNDDRSFILFKEDYCDAWGGNLIESIDGNCQPLEILHNPISDLDGAAHLFWPYLSFPGLPGLPDYALRSGKDVILYYKPDSLYRIGFASAPNQICISEQGDFVVISQDSVFSISMSNGIPTVIARRFYPFKSIREMHFATDTTMFVLHDDQLILFDQQLNTLAAFAPYDSLHARFSKWQDPYLIMLADYDKVDQNLMVFNSDMGTAYVGRWDRRVGYNEDIVWSADSTLTLAGGEWYHTVTYPSLKTIPFGSRKQKPQVDVGLSDISFSTRHTEITNPCYAEDTYTTFLDDVEIEITNYGEQTVNDVVITPEKSTCFMYCFYDTLYRTRLYDLDLEPGSSIRVQLGNVYIENPEFFSDKDSSLCLQVILPDNRIDADHGNNMVCLLSGVVTATDMLSLIQTSVAPNPAKDQVTHFLPADQDVHISIVSLHGEIMVEMQSAFQSTLTTDISTLAAGMYVVQHKTKSGMGLHKLIVQ